MVKEIKSSLDNSKGSKKFIGLPPLPAGQYEAYIPYSGWRAQGRFRHKLRQEINLRKEALKAVFIVGGVYFLLTEFTRTPMLGHSTSYWLNFAVYAYLLIMMYPLIVAPSNIQIGKEGIRLHWVSFLGLVSAPWISWSSISLVSVSNFSRHFYKSKAIEFSINREGLPLSLRLLLPLLKPYLSFSGFNLSQPLKLSFDINAITHEADLPVLLRVIRNMLPVENLADEVLELEEAKGQTFTKLWLDSLQGVGRRLSLTTIELGDNVLYGQYEYYQSSSKGICIAGAWWHRNSQACFRECRARSQAPAKVEQ